VRDAICSGLEAPQIKHNGQRHPVHSVLISINIARILKRFITKAAYLLHPHVDPGLSGDEAVQRVFCVSDH